MDYERELVKLEVEVVKLQGLIKQKGPKSTAIDASQDGDITRISGSILEPLRQWFFLGRRRRKEPGDISNVNFPICSKPVRGCTLMEAGINEPRWKLSPMDLEARSRWVDYSRARYSLSFSTNAPYSLWNIVETNAKRHASLKVISHPLGHVPYKDLIPKPLKLLPRRKMGVFRHLDFFHEKRVAETSPVTL